MEKVIQRVRNPVTNEVYKDEIVLHTLMGIISRNNWTGNRKHLNRKSLVDYAMRYEITPGEVALGLNYLRKNGHVEIDSYGPSDDSNYVNITIAGKSAYHIPV